MGWLRRKPRGGRPDAATHRSSDSVCDSCSDPLNHTAG